LDIKYRSSKLHILLLPVKTVFPMFDSLSVPSVEVRMPKKGCKGHLEFRPATGNAGTWTCQRGAYEHGCEFAPVAGQNVLPAEIPSAPYRSYTASAPGGQCRYPVKASGKTVYHQAKHAAKNNWHFPSHKQISFG